MTPILLLESSQKRNSIQSNLDNTSKLEPVINFNPTWLHITFNLISFMIKLSFSILLVTLLVIVLVLFSFVAFKKTFGFSRMLILGFSLIEVKDFTNTNIELENYLYWLNMD